METNNKEYAFNDVPFNFVPLNHEVFIPDWGDKISHDIPFEDGEDGIIRFTLTNTTPLFIKNDNSKDTTDSAYVEDSIGNRHYFIPATSIKGMVRSVMEIMSFGWMRQYDNDSFGYRTFGGKGDTDAKNYTAMMSDIRCGWLRMLPDGTSYELADCGEPQKIETIELPAFYQKVKEKNAVEKYEAFEESGKGLYPEYKNGMRLVCTGAMKGKKHEYLFPNPDKYQELITISREAIETFKSAYKPSPYTAFIYKQLNSGNPLAIFFKKSKEGVIDSIGLTRMYRYPYKHRVADGIVQTGYDEQGSYKDGCDLVECIFGYINKKHSLRGRIQFGNAFCTNGSIKEQEEEKGVLGQPQASYYPYYLKQKRTPYVSYDSEKIEIAGRKRYRIHSNANGSDFPTGNDNENTLTRLRPLPAGCQFVCEVKLHNVRPIEIGALLSAMTFHGNGSCHHNIGMAKAVGYGRIELSDITLTGLSHEDINFYQKEFEICMSRFLFNSLHIRWNQSPQLQALCAIASDHNNPLGYMLLDGYKQGKNNMKFSTLTENGINIESLISDRLFLEMFCKSLLNDLENELKCNDFTKAKKICEEMKQRISPIKNLFLEEQCQEIETAVKEQTSIVDKKYTDFISAFNTIDWHCAKALGEELLLLSLSQEKRHSVENFIKIIDSKIRNAPKFLSDILESKTTSGDFKVREFKQANNNIASWIKKTGRPLKDDELADLGKTLRRIKANTTKKSELKEQGNFSSKEWKRLSSLISEECAQNIFNAINNS